MGKDLRYLPDGQDFDHSSFDKGFGFSGSTQGGEKRRSSPPFAGDESDASSPNLQNYAKGGPIGGHPDGHQVIRVHHDPSSGAVIHHHTHGGYTMHHPDGNITHHGHDGQPAMAQGAHNPGEGTFLSKGRPPEGSPAEEAGESPAEEAAEGGGESAMARGGHFGGKHMSGAKEPMNRPPRNPMRNPSTRNAMPGGQMPYGVQPSAEPDTPEPAPGPGSDGDPAMRRGGKVHMAEGGYTKFTGTPSPALRDAAEEANTRYLNTNQGSDAARSSDPAIRWGEDSNVSVRGGAHAKGGRIRPRG